MDVCWLLYETIHMGAQIIYEFNAEHNAQNIKGYWPLCNPKSHSNIYACQDTSNLTNRSKARVMTGVILT